MTRTPSNRTTPLDRNLSSQIREPRELGASRELDDGGPFRAIVDELTEYVVRWKPGGIRTFVNSAYCKAFGAPAEELIGTSFYPLVSPEHRQSVEARIGRLSPESPVSTAEHKVALPDGTVGWQRWTDRALFDSSDRLVEYQSVGHDITERKLHEQELRASRERLSRLTIELQRAEERERRRIATYLHDEVGQALAVLRMKLATLDSDDQARSAEIRKDIGRILDATIETVRSVTLDLAPPVLYELGLPTAVEWIGRRIANESGLDFEFEDDGTDKPLSEPAGALLFRGARELIMNAVKHSNGSRVRVSIGRCGDERLEVVVEDDGRGIDDGAVEPGSASDGFGLFSLRERLHALGGELVIESRQSGGTRAAMLVPIARP